MPERRRGRLLLVPLRLSFWILDQAPLLKRSADNRLKCWSDLSKSVSRRRDKTKATKQESKSQQRSTAYPAFVVEEIRMVAA